MSRIIRVLGVPISALVLVAILMSSLATEVFASASGGIDLPGPPVSHQYIAKPSAPSSATLKLFKRGAALYKKICGYSASTQKCTHSAKYQTNMLKKLSAADRKAVRTFISKQYQQKYTVKTGSKANACVPSKTTRCPLGMPSPSSVRKFTAIKTSTNANGAGGCWQWTIDISEGGFVQPFPFPLTWYTFELNNSFCSDGNVITKWFVEPKYVYAMVLFWDCSGFSDHPQTPTIGATTVEYSVQANCDMSPPAIKGITGVVIHRHPWIHIWVGANGDGIYTEGVS